jgi:rhamnogalacturonan acetylesterase
VAALLAKGAIPIISSLTPNNIWSGTTITAGGRFVTYAKSIGTRRNIVYVDHFSYTAQAYNKLGEAKTTTFFPNDHLHTNAAGALVVAQTFVRGVLCSSSALKSKINTAGQAVPSKCISYILCSYSKPASVIDGCI